jgi:hypothetical protein
MNPHIDIDIERKVSGAHGCLKGRFYERNDEYTGPYKFFRIGVFKDGFKE